ncbi:MAG: kynureninase, partial [Alphaproteobacteria bacterium]
LEAGVVGSFRKPDVLRFGLGPLALGYHDIWRAVARLRQVLESGIWREPRFARVSV